jgi:hypothetical protein
MDSRRMKQPGSLTRREFLEASAGAAGGTALLAGATTILLRANSIPPGKPWQEATIPQLQDLMASGQLTSRELTLAYLRRSASHTGGNACRSGSEPNPEG